MPNCLVVKKSTSLHAVLTGDIVNSTKLSLPVEQKLMKGLNFFLSSHLSEFYRGDSFQVYVKEPTDSLKLALLCRTAAISLTSDNDEAFLADVRISIGIGPVQLPIKTPGTAKGEAFLISGRRFDDLQRTGGRLSMKCNRPIADIALEVMSDFIDAIYSKMTAKQAAVIMRLLQGESQQQAALSLNRSKGTISELVNAGRWPEIERLLQQFELLINQVI